MNQTEQLLAEIIAEAHPKMAESIHMAAIPHWFDLLLFSAIRHEDDDRNEGIIQRLTQRYSSFIVPVLPADVPTYRVRDEERMLLNLLWIKENPSGYLVAHQHAYDYYEQQQQNAGLPQSGIPQSVVEYDSIIDGYPQLYHHFFVDLPVANRELQQIFREFYKWRKVGAIDNLLEMVDEVHTLLERLGQASQSGAGGGLAGSAEGGQNGNGSSEPDASHPLLPSSDALAQFHVLRTHYQTQAMQLRDQWQESLDDCRSLRFDPNLPENLAPGIIRAYGAALTHTHQYSDGIAQLELALDGFTRLAADSGDHARSELHQNQSHQNQLSHNELDDFEVEQAYTMLALGEGYVEFARSLRGTVLTEPARNTLLQRFYNILAFLFNIPLVVYLSRFLGMRVWYPNFWPTLRNLDWIVARLFAKAVDYYERSDVIFEKRPDAIHEHEIADQHLGILFMRMGDVDQAQHHFRRMLDDPRKKLTDFQRSRVNIGLAWTLIQSGQHDLAISILEGVLPAVESIEDQAIVADIHAWLAQAYIATERPNDSIHHFTKALEGYKFRQQSARATSLTEQLEQQINEAKSRSASWAATARTKLTEASTGLQERVYEIGYRHPWLTSFLQLVTLAIFAVIVLSLLMTLHLDTALSLQPELTVDVPQLLDPTQPVSPSVLGVTNTRLQHTNDASAQLISGVLLLMGFFLFSFLFGIGAIIFTPLSRLQRQQEKEIIVTEEAIEARVSDKRIRIPWDKVTQWVRADVRVWNDALPEYSGTALCSRDYSLLVPGLTTSYASLTGKIQARYTDSESAIPTIPKRDLSYAFLRSWVGLLYGLNLLLLAVIIAATWFEADRFIWVDLLGTSYSLADLYPYLYIPLVLVPIWWMILRPLQILLYTARISQLPTIVIGGGLFVSLLLVLTRFRPLFSVPDLYPALVVLLCMFTATFVIWNLKDGSSPYYDRWPRLVSLGLTLLVTILLVGVLQRDVRAYHNFVIGNTARDRDNTEQAIQNYERAVEIGKTRMWGIDPADTLKAIGLSQAIKDWLAAKEKGYGLLAELKLSDPWIPQRDTIPWFVAQKNLAALQSQEGDHDAAIQNYTELLAIVCPVERDHQCDGGQEKFYAWRAMARARCISAIDTQIAEEQSATAANGNMPTCRSKDEPPDLDLYAAVLEDYARAISQNPEDPQYYLWKGVASQTVKRFADAEDAYEMALQHSIDNPPFQLKVETFQGWLALEQDQFDQAITLFSDVITQSMVITDTAIPLDTEIQALRGLAYTSYEKARFSPPASVARRQSASDVPSSEEKIELYEQAEVAFATIQERSGESPEVTTALATVHWAKARHTTEQCTEWEESARLFEEGLEFEQSQEDLAFTYRSLAQVQFLLGARCVDEGFEKVTQYRLAIDNYTEAINLVSSDYYLYPYYIHMRARIGYALSLILPSSSLEGQAEQIDRLIAALADFQNALESGDRRDRDIEIEGRESAIAFQYEPNKYGRLAIFHALTLIEQAIEAGDEATKEKLWAALVPLLPLIEGADTLLKSQYDTKLKSTPGTPKQTGLIELLAEGLKLLMPESPLSILADAHQPFSQGDWQVAARLYQENQSKLEGIDISHVDVVGAGQLAGLALLANDIQRSAQWYSLLILKTVPAENQAYKDARNSLWPIWLATEKSAAQLLPALETALEQTLETAPQKATDGYYWSIRAWFKYTIGLGAFRYGDEDTARLALELAQPDADRAFALGHIGRDVAATYFIGGAWGWYHIVRGNDAFAQEEYTVALADYTRAFNAFQPMDNQTAQAEHVEAGFKVGLAYFALEQHRNAHLWYTDALALAKTYGGNPQLPGKVTEAVTELNAQPAYSASARTAKAQILGKLQ
ncbi:MAG: tetratricopeptide repeat protein [Chloroflexota bacterium]